MSRTAEPGSGDIDYTGEWALQRGPIEYMAAEVISRDGVNIYNNIDMLTWHVCGKLTLC
jgi:hypothetical protein